MHTITYIIMWFSYLFSPGCLTYNDQHDLPKQSHLIKWLENHKEACADVDVVCSQQVAVNVLKAPYTEQSALPWEIKLTRGPDGICYLEELWDWWWIIILSMMIG